MIQVRMKRTESGSEDGVNVTRYEEGQVYNLSDRLAQRFIDHGAAVRVRAELETPEGSPAGGETPEGSSQGQGSGETPEGQGEGQGGEGPTDEEVAQAIRGLDAGNDDHWTNGGKPDVRAISDALNARIYADQRDRVWDAMQAGDL